MRIMVLFFVVILSTGCLTAEQQAALANKGNTDQSSGEDPILPAVCANGSNGSHVINPSEDEYRQLALGVNQIAILSDFRRAFYSGVRSDDPVLEPYYDAMDLSESLVGPFSLSDDGLRILDRNGVEIIHPNDPAFQDETDLIFRHQAIASFFAAERLGVKSNDPQFDEIYRLMAEERSGARTYGLSPLGITGISWVVRCD